MTASGRLPSGDGTFKPIQDKGCSHSPKCLECPYPVCKLEELEKRRADTRAKATFQACFGAVTAREIRDE